MSTKPRQDATDARDAAFLDDEEDEREYVLTTIEADALVDAIETMEVEPEETGPRRYRLTMHIDLPEHIAQDFFTTYVRNGRVNVEFHPADEDETYEGA